MAPEFVFMRARAAIREMMGRVSEDQWAPCCFNLAAGGMGECAGWAFKANSLSTVFPTFGAWTHTGAQAKQSSCIGVASLLPSPPSRLGEQMMTEPINKDEMQGFQAKAFDSLPDLSNVPLFQEGEVKSSNLRKH